MAEGAGAARVRVGRPRSERATTYVRHFVAFNNHEIFYFQIVQVDFRSIHEDIKKKVWVLRTLIKDFLLPPAG